MPSANSCNLCSSVETLDAICSTASSEVFALANSWRMFMDAAEYPRCVSTMFTIESLIHWIASSRPVGVWMSTVGGFVGTLPTLEAPALEVRRALRGGVRSRCRPRSPPSLIRSSRSALPEDDDGRGGLDIFLALRLSSGANDKSRSPV